MFWSSIRRNFGREPSKANNKLSGEEKAPLEKVAWVQADAQAMDKKAANAPAVTPSAPVLQIYQDPNRLKSVPEIQEVASDESDGGSSAPEEPPAVPSRTARRGKSK